MCLSGLVQIVYGILCIAGLAATLVSIFTPGWQDFDVRQGVENAINDVQNGLLPFNCAFNGKDTPNMNNPEYCAKWFNALPTSEKVVVACMCLAVIVEVICFIYNIVSFCACCCKSCMLPILAIITIVVDILLAIAVIIYVIDNHKYVDPLQDVIQQGFNAQTKVGWSFWLACAALAVNVVNTFVAGIAACCAETCC